MVMAKLHIICGNCGSNNMLQYEIVEDYNDDKECNYNRVCIICENCSTIHNLEDNAEERKKIEL